MSNPFSRKDFNLTEQMKIARENPSMAEKMRTEAAQLDAEETLKKNTRSLDEFNALSKEQKITFISNNGEVR